MAATRSKKEKPSNVVPLNSKRDAPHPARLDAMQQWHHAKSAQQDQAVAAVHISITQDGMVRTEGIAVEQSHAQAMLAAVPKLVEQLERQAGYIQGNAPAPHLVQVGSSRRPAFRLSFSAPYNENAFADVFKALKRAAS